jgi:hypothetical protein
MLWLPANTSIETASGAKYLRNIGGYPSRQQNKTHRSATLPILITNIRNGTHQTS